MTTLLRMTGILSLVLGVSAAASVASAKVKEGDPFPAITLPSLDGKSKFSITKHKGKVVIVDFWASWCEPCKIELPALNALYKKYKSKGLVVVGVNLDEKKEDANKFLKDNPVQFPLAFDGDKKAMTEKVEIQKMPTSFIVDKSGKVAVRHEAFRAGDEVKLEKEIQRLLKAK